MTDTAPGEGGVSAGDGASGARTDGSGGTGDGDDGESASTGSGAGPPARRRRRSALAWGAVAALSFLVLHQAYLLTGGRFVGVVPVAAVALAVGTAGAALSFLLERRLGVRRR